MELYLLRHGRTDYNERRLYCGSTDLPLTPGGRAELEELAVRRPLPDFFLTADTGMLRTRETAEEVSARYRSLLPEETDKFPVRFQQEILFSADDIQRRQPSAVFLKLPEKIARIVDAGPDLLRIPEGLPVIVIVRHRVLVLGRHILHVVRQDRGRHGKGPFEFLRIVICRTDCPESAH